MKSKFRVDVTVMRLVRGFIAPVFACVLLTFAQVPASGHGTLPSALIDLTNWKLQLPVDQNPADGSADEVKQTTLSAFEVEQATYVFHERQDAIRGDGVAFRANAGGVPTSGSTYARTELREMQDSGQVQSWWNPRDGNQHVMTMTEAITALPPNKPHVVAGQIHDGGAAYGGTGDVLQIRLESNHLFVRFDNGDAANYNATLTSNYVLGTKFTIQVKVTPAGISVLYDGALKVSNYWPQNVGPTWYFKAGCYIQSNTVNGSGFAPDASSAYAEVVIYQNGLTVQHGPIPPPPPSPVHCGGLVATGVGTSSDDVIYGTAGADVIAAGDGNDVVYGLGGNDVICGGSGNDVLKGGAGAKDRLYGEVGSDRLVGGAGTRDFCKGGPSSDIAKKCEISRSI